MDPMQPLLAIALVMALLGGALFVLKRRGAASFHLPGVSGRSNNGLKRLELMERISLGPHHALHLVRAGERCVLIATSPSSCQLLDNSISAGERK
jgi:flagellar biogenesis protein FliO